MEEVRKKIGNHTVDCIENFGNDTVILSFDGESEGDGWVITQVEFWTDENEWKYTDIWYDNDGNYTEQMESQRLTDEDKDQVKVTVKEWIENH